MNINKAILVGRLTRDPEVRTTATGQTVTSISIATNRFWKDKNGQKQDQTEFHNVVLWGKLGEIAGQYLTKGQEAYIEGRLTTRKYTGKDGIEKRTTEIVAENMQLGSRAGQGGGQQGQAQGGGGQRRRRPHHNRPRNPNAQNNPHQNAQHPQGINIERIYEKYLNLLDQHLIARRKYHDLFYRADPAQKNKLERNFYNTLNDVRDFESKLAPEARELFEKRNNGLRPDNTYTSNHEIPVEGELPPAETSFEDPHFLQSQLAANYADDKEESVGTLDDYLKYKNLV